MMPTTAPETCPLCSQRLAEPTLDALEQHFPDCTATETKRTSPAPPAGKPARGWGRWGSKRTKG